MNLKDYCVAVIPELKVVLHLKKVFVGPNCHSKREREMSCISSICGCGFDRELSEEVVFEIFPLVERKELFLDLTNDRIIELKLEDFKNDFR